MAPQQHPTDEEIRSYMNFDTLLEKSRASANASGIKAVLKWGIPVFVLATLGIVFFYQDELRPTVAERKGIKSDVPAAIDSSKTGRASTDNNQARTATDSILTGEAPKKNIDAGQEKAAAIVDQTPLGEKESPSADYRTSSQEASDYKQAEPTDGYPDLYQYFNANLMYPQEALKDSIQGVQTISFVINVDGKPEHIQVIESLGEPFEKEAKRLIENMPAWKPATLNGKPVASKVSLPLTFQIQKVKP